MKKAGNGPYDRSQNMRPNCGIFEREKWSSRDCSIDVRGCLGVISVILCIKCLLGSLSEPMFCDFPGILNEGFNIPGIVFSKYIFL